MYLVGDSLLTLRMTLYFLTFEPASVDSFAPLTSHFYFLTHQVLWLAQNKKAFLLLAGRLNCVVGAAGLAALILLSGGFKTVKPTFALLP